MAGGRRKTAPSPSKTGGETKVAVEEDAVIVVDESSSESEVKRLRGRWELASILNFLSVFGPVIGYDLKLTAEEIEMGLIEPDSSNAQLHIVLLKGIPPVSKKLNEPGAWVTVLCKKLAIWWPWVSEGEIPLTIAKGEEVSKYKELEPMRRLQILRALCEIRADQNDAVSYIHDSLKQGTQISCFRKDKIGRDVNEASYWYDGNTTIGYRLYREVDKTAKKAKLKGKACSSPPASSFQWETLATNLEEFRKVVDELSSSKFADDVVLGNTIQKDIFPDVEKFQKKKERSLKRKQRQETLLQNGFRNSNGVGITRACRSRRPISYTFDDYDRAIDEAIELNKKSKTVKEQRHERRKVASGGGSVVSMSSKDSSGRRDDSEASDTESDKLEEACNGDDGKVCGSDNEINYDDGEKDNANDDDNYDGEEDDGKGNGDSHGSSNSEEEKDNPVEKNHSTFQVQKPSKTRSTKRLNGGARHPVEARTLGTKNRSRQRPLRNSAIDSVVVDSEDEKLSEHENMSVVADSEEVSDD